MEITRTVSALRTTLNHIEHTLACDLKSISGQDQEAVKLIDTIVTDLRLQSFFQIEDDDQLRKLHFLLFLNTDMKISPDLENNCNIGHVVGAIPQLSSRLYFALAKRYNLFKYMNETLEFCPIIMIAELLDIIDAEVKYLPAVDRFEILCSVLEIVCIRLTKTDCKYSVKKLAEHFQALMLHYKKLVVDTEESKKKSILQIAAEGYKFASLISLFLSLTENVFGEHSERESSPSIYQITIHFDVASWYDEFKLRTNSDTIRVCYENVFFKCRELMEELDLDMFLTWYEVPMKETNLQTHIAKEVYHLCDLLQRVQSSNSLPTDTEVLISMLQSIAVKPAVGTLVTSDANNLSVEESILQNDVFDQSFLEHVERFLRDSHFPLDMGITLIRKLFDEKSRPNINSEYVRSLIELAMQKLETCDLKVLLDELITKNGLNHFMNKDSIDYSIDFMHTMKLLSSYFTKDDIDSESQEEEFVLHKEKQILKDVAIMGFQMKYTDLKEIIREACTDRHDVIVVIKLLETLRTICSYKLETKCGRSHSVLVNILKEFLENDYQNLTLAEKNKFSHVVISLSSHELVNKDDFLSVCLLPLLYVNENCNWSLLSELLLLFKDLFRDMHCDLTLCWPILLIQIAQILEDSRWSMTTFSDERMIVCQRAIDAVKVLMEHPKDITECVRRWMVTQLKTYSFLTRSYFTNICQPDATLSIDELIARLIHGPPQSHEDFEEDYLKNGNDYVVKMGKLLLCCTQEEIQRIVENYAQGESSHMSFIFDWMSDSITFASNTVWHFARLNIELVSVVYSCLGVLVRNFLSVLLKNATVAEEFDYIKYINRIIIVVRKFPENRANVCQFNILKFLAEEVPKLNRRSHNFLDNVEKLLTGLYVL